MFQFLEFRKVYGNFLALKIDNLILENNIYWVKGENGSGKSTMLKVLAGILSFEGDIILNKLISIKKDDIKYRKLVNFAEAEPLFPEFLTGRELLNVFLYSKKAPTRQEEYFLESMKMQNFIDRPIGTYSSGMLKKLSLVAAFVGNPKVILLDEPLITLDSESVKILYQWIAEHRKEHGIGFMLSSHQDIDFDSQFIAKVIQVEAQTIKLNRDAITVK